MKNKEIRKLLIQLGKSMEEYSLEKERLAENNFAACSCPNPPEMPALKRHLKLSGKVHQTAYQMWKISSKSKR